MVFGPSAFYYVQMDISHASSLKEGARVAVFMGAIVSDIYGTPPIVTTATVLGIAEDGTSVWLNVDIAQGQQLPQRYRIEEVLGFLMPMATVTSDGNGTIWGTLPPDYVGP